MRLFYTDGACKGNPGPGGWGVVEIIGGAVAHTFGGGETDTTNNRMELQAAIGALLATEQGSEVTIVTDSNYVKNGITAWITGWKRNGWKSASGSPVKNKDLWLQLDQIAAARRVTWRWVKGHSSDAFNEAADATANRHVP